MFLIEDMLITAPATETILNGITRDSVLTLAREWGLQVEERPVKVDEVEQALFKGTLKEAFGTGTAATIANIAQMNIKGTTYTLPTLDENALSKKILKTLDGIKRGTLADKHGWIVTL